MAAAVYIHNALFSRSTIRNSIHSTHPGEHDISQPSSSSHSRSSSAGSYHDAQETARPTTARGRTNVVPNEGEEGGAHDAARASAAVGSTSTSDSHAELTERLRRDEMATREKEHGRKSSEATLVPFFSRRASGKNVKEADARRVRGGMPSSQEEPQRGEEKLNEESRLSTEANAHGHSGSRFVDVPLHTTMTTTELPSTTTQQPEQHSSLPPGLSQATSLTSRHQPTPYPFPTRNSTAQAPNQQSSPSDNNHRTRPKGRRRTTSSPLERRLDNLLPLRKGRVPNRNLTRRTRVGILLFRFVLTCILVGWTAYECARYWLAYFEFRPSSTSSQGPIPKEDPPRSQYALAFAICSSIAAGLLALDLSWFLYFVLYPLESRPVQRTPTIAPIARNDSNAPTTVPPTSPPTIEPSVDPLQSSRTRVPAPDSEPPPANRQSTYSTSSSRRQSRRLSKARPDSWTGYPPVPNIPPGIADSGDEARPSYAETRPSRDTDVDVQQRPRYQAHAIDLTHSPPRRVAQLDQSITEIHRDSADATRPSSQYYSGDEIAPQVEKHDRSTYKLHLPINCHEPSISPLPPPVGADTLLPPGPQVTAAAQVPGALPAPATGETAPNRRTSKVPINPTPKRGKWTKNRRFLHVVHWLAFIAINIPALVNVALVPLWYNPESSSAGGPFTGINSPHRLSGLCRWSPDVLWAGTALPPAYPPCTPKISYRVWLWGAIGRVLITFFIAGLWIILDGLWWGAWVVGTRNIGWRGSIPIPREWRPKRQPTGEVKGEESHAEDTADESDGRQDLKESGLWKRMRLMSGASKASARSGRSGRSQKEKGRESSIYPAPPVPPLDRERMELTSPGGSIDPLSASTSTDAIAGGASSGGEGVGSPNTRHRVKRKPVRHVSPPTSSYFSPSAFEATQMERQSALGAGSRRPSTHDSIGGSTVVGSPPAQSYLPSSPLFSPASPPLSGSSHHGHGTEENQTIAFGRRSMGLEMLPELERSADVEEGSSNQQTSQPPQRPFSRLARYDDPNIYGDKYSPPTPPSPSSSSYPPSSSRPSWTADMNAFSPITSPDADAPLLGRGYFMVGDGGFSATLNEGAYDGESYYRMVNANQAGRRSGEERPISPLSDRSTSPTSYGHGHIAPLDVRVETPNSEGDRDDDLNDPRYNAASSNVPWYVQHPSNDPLSPPPLVPTYQHPLAHGIQLALGRPPEPPEREVRMLGGIVRRMSTIESFGSHERELELSRRGSAGTSRTNQTGRNNGATREGTGGSGSGHSGGRHPGTSGSGSGDHSGEKTTEEEAIGRAASPTELSPT